MENGVIITAVGAGSRLVPENVTSVTVDIWGGGGGGYDVGPGGGGGGGGWVNAADRPVTPGATVTYVVGRGGIVTVQTSSTTTYYENEEAYVYANGGGNGAGSSGGAGGTRLGDGGDSAAGDAGVTTSGETPGNGGAAGGPDGGAGGTGVAGTGDAPSNPGATPGGGGGGRVNGTDFTLVGRGAPGGIRFTWTEELLDSFEETPLTSTLAWSQTWSDGSANGGTIDRTTTDVTQGTYSWSIAISDVSGDMYPGIESPLVDLTGYSEITLDINIDTLPTGGYFTLSLYDPVAEDYHTSMGSIYGVAGDTTLSVVLTGATIDLSSCHIQIYGYGASGPLLAYIDNLRGVLET